MTNMAPGQTPGKSAAAFMAATSAQKHLFMYFYAPGKNDPKVHKLFVSAMQKLGGAAQSVEINIKDKTETALVQKFRLEQAPLPLVLVIAPNGAIVGGYPNGRITEDVLMGSLASPCFQRCLRGLQENKIILLCAYPSDPTKPGPQIPKGVLDFYSDPKYQPTTKIITLDPSNMAEKRLIGLLHLDPSSKEMTTCILAHGSMVASLPGAVKKKDIVDALTKSSSPRMPGGPGGPGGPSAQGGPGGPGNPGGPSQAPQPK
jgi:hypothetical protein